MRKSTGLRTEVLTTISLLMGAALLLGGVMMLRLTEQGLLDQKLAQLRVLTGTLTLALAGTVDSAQAENILKRLPVEMHLDGWWYYDAKLLQTASFSAGNATSSKPSLRQQVKLSGQPFEAVDFPTLLHIFTDADVNALFIQPISKQGVFRGLLEIRYSLDDVRQRLLLFQQMILLYVLLYGSVLVFVGYYLLQRNVIGPARNLLQATEAVGRGNLETRLPVAGPTEIAHLADAYNRMVEALQESRLETRSHIETLEQTNAELQQTRDELIRSEKLASVGQLAAGLAHELGNPLAALIGYLEVLKGRLESDNAEIVRCSLAEAERIDFLVRELLDFSRPSADFLEMVNPVDEIRNSLELLKNQGRFERIEIVDSLPGLLPQVRCSRQRLQQVFVNLLLNAVHACRDGGQVKVAAASDQGFVHLKFIDDGCGISKADLNRIFDPFYTTKPPGQGTGLGLAVCKRIIDSFGGQIAVSSTPGVGSCFEVLLPVTDVLSE